MKYLAIIIPFDNYDERMLYSIVEEGTAGDAMLKIAQSILGDEYEEKLELLSTEYQGNVTAFFDTEIAENEGVDFCSLVFNIDTKKVIYEPVGVRRITI